MTDYSELIKRLRRVLRMTTSTWVSLQRSEVTEATTALSSLTEALEARDETIALCDKEIDGWISHGVEADELIRRLREERDSFQRVGIAAEARLKEVERAINFAKGHVKERFMAHMQYVQGAPGGFKPMHGGVQMMLRSEIESLFADLAAGVSLSPSEAPK